MTFRVKLSLHGCLATEGLLARLDLWRSPHHQQTCDTRLPPAPELAQVATEFWDLWASYPNLRIKVKGVQRQLPLPLHRQQCQIAADRLQTLFNNWLGGESFREMTHEILRFSHPSDDLWLSIATDDRHVPRLPWDEWKPLKGHRFAWGCCSTSGKTPPIQVRSTPGVVVRILAVLGDRVDLNLDPDYQALQQLSNEGLADVQLLDAPTPEQFFDALRDQQPQVLVFAGHGYPETKSRSSQIGLNFQNNISVENFSHALEGAVQQGLQLAIFNCCHSVDLAEALHRSHLPAAIVMRASVPDLVAQHFLKDFLTHYAQSRSLPLSLYEARRSLQRSSAEFPRADWLPLVFHHPLLDLPTWPDRAHSEADFQSWIEPVGPSAARPGSDRALRQDPIQNFSQEPGQEISQKSSQELDQESNQKLDQESNQALSPENNQQISSKISLKISPKSLQLGGQALLATGITIGLGGMIQTPEFWVYDAMVQRRPLELQDQRILLVTIDENDVAYQDRQGWQRIPTADGGLNSVAPEALAKLQERLATLKPSVIGVDIYYPWPLTSAWQKRLWSNPRVVGLCKLADPTESVVEIPAPVGLKRDRVGFSDQADDSEGVVRRQLLAMAAPQSSQTCHTTYGLSGLVVDEYLKQRGVAILAVGNRWQYGSVTIPQITAGAGGYGWFDDQGNQLLLAPRRADWVRLPLREVLQSTDRIPWTGQPNPIVLIGNIQANSGDWWKLPGGQEIPGLEIQAHGISQLISAVLDNRPLLQAIAWPQKALWILLWAVLGAGLLAVWQARSPQPRWYDRLWVWAFGSLMVGAIGMISFFWAAWWLPVVSPMVAIGLVLLPLPGRKGRSQFSRWLGLVRQLPRRLLKSS